MRSKEEEQNTLLKFCSISTEIQELLGKFSIAKMKGSRSVFFLRFRKRFSVVYVNEPNGPIYELKADEDYRDSFSGKYQQ